MTAQQTARSAELAGMRMGKKIQTEPAYGYRVQEVKDGYLWYRVLDLQKSAAATGLLQGFINLADSPDNAVIQFARKHGCMGLCGHGLPPYAHGCNVRAPRRDGDLFGESIDHYRRMAKLYQTILGLGAEIQLGRPGRPEDWDVLGFLDEPAFPNRQRLSTRFKLFDEWGLNKPKKGRSTYFLAARQEMEIAIGYMIEVANVRPRFTWKDSWRIELGSGGPGANLPAVLLLQLLPVMADVDGYAVCSSCHRAYIPSRRPDPTRNNYCEMCGRRAAVRDAKRRQREKQREAQSNG